LWNGDDPTMAKSKKDCKNENINVDNVDDVVLDAIASYFDKNMWLDAMFWRTCIHMLEVKYKFELKRGSEKK
jgi:uncharacterized protein YaeQ